MRMRSIIFSIGIIFLSIIFLAGCGGNHISSKGAIVNIYSANSITSNLICSSGSRKDISYMYVGKKTITGNISDQDKSLLSQYAKAGLQESRFISPVAVPAMEGEYPELSIYVIEFFVKDIREENGLQIKRDGRFVANFSIRQAGIIECSTGKPIFVEKSFIEPAYKRNKLPSILQVKRMLIKEAIKRITMQFVPVKMSILRPVKSGYGKLREVANMIDSGNCKGAYQIIKKDINAPGCKDAHKFYDAGVAMECMAWSIANDNPDQQISYLKMALKYYTKAGELDPDDAEIQRAISEVSYSVKVLLKAAKRQKKTKKLLEDLKTPAGF